MTPESERRRSVAFLEADGETWACFLVTSCSVRGRWHGYFAFRRSGGEAEEDEVRTADIFIEATEEEIDRKARALGRPLLSGLLESARFTAQRDRGGAGPLRGRFRSLLVRSSEEIAGDWSEHGGRAPSGFDLERLRSIYASYRLDQVAHLIGLIEPVHFDGAVDRVLDGERIDFLAQDRMQYAMMVVDHIERLLPLPDFGTWAQDFLSRPETYRLYTHTLHREGRLP